MKCYNCQTFGNFAHECLELKKVAVNNIFAVLMKCYNFQTFGHFAHEFLELKKVAFNNTFVSTICVSNNVLLIESYSI